MACASPHERTLRSGHAKSEENERLLLSHCARRRGKSAQSSFRMAALMVSQSVPGATCTRSICTPPAPRERSPTRAGPRSIISASCTTTIRTQVAVAIGLVWFSVVPLVGHTGLVLETGELTGLWKRRRLGMVRTVFGERERRRLQHQRLRSTPVFAAVGRCDRSRC